MIRKFFFVCLPQINLTFYSNNEIMSPEIWYLHWSSYFSRSPDPWSRWQIFTYFRKYPIFRWAVNICCNLIVELRTFREQKSPVNDEKKKGSKMNFWSDKMSKDQDLLHIKSISKSSNLFWVFFVKRETIFVLFFFIIFLFNVFELSFSSSSVGCESVLNLGGKSKTKINEKNCNR